MTTLDALAHEPALAAQLTPEERAQLLAAALACVGALAAPAATSTPPAAAGEPGPEWLTPEAVTTRYGLSARWLEDHAAELRRQRIVAAPSRKVRVYHARRLGRYLEARVAG